MSFTERLRLRAAELQPRIAFVEGEDARVDAALREITSRGIARPVLVFDSDVSRPVGSNAHREMIDTASDGRVALVADELSRTRPGKVAANADPARDARSPLVFANYLLAHGFVDGVVAGALYTTGAVVRTALAMIGRAPGVTSVSGAFYMVVPPFRGRDEVLTFADCAVIREPDAGQLAAIGIAAARDRRLIVGDEPIIAFLSYSTHGSAAGPSVDTVRAAVALMRETDPAVVVDGELQGDAALVEEIARRKAPASPVKGNANVLVFPSLDAGNIAYKLVQRIAQAGAIGPILQGLARPCNDLSRGSNVDDIVNVAAVTALQTASGT